MAALLEVDQLRKYYPARGGGVVRAVDGISFRVEAGKTLALVGESGCGKSTVGRAVLRLQAPTAGRVIFEGRDLSSLTRRELRALRPQMQIVFQNPFEALNPRLPAGEIIGEAVRVHRIVPRNEYRRYVIRVMEECGLAEDYFDKYPHEFSGGQRQRVCIARALALQPRFLVADEPVSALDVSVQAQILNLLRERQRERGLAYLFITHDLSVARYIADDISVMYLGKIVEWGDKKGVFSHPCHPYTRALLAAVPRPEPGGEPPASLEGEVPSPVNPPRGCAFHPRCPLCGERCREETPPAAEVEKGHFAACHLLSGEGIK